MRAKAVLRLKLPSERYLGIIYEALIPEIKPTTTRSKATIKKDGKMLVLRVEGRDTVALRATLNTYLRWIDSVAEVLEVLESVS